MQNADLQISFELVLFAAEYLNRQILAETEGAFFSRVYLQAAN